MRYVAGAIGALIVVLGLACYRSDVHPIVMIRLKSRVISCTLAAPEPPR